MKRTTLNLTIDLLAALLFVSMVATGYIIRFPLPPGTNKSLSLWGLSRHQWGGVHFWISLALLGVLLAHLTLHWGWVVTVVRQRLRLAAASKSPHLVSGLLTLLIVTGGLAGFAWAAHACVKELEVPCCPPSADVVQGESGKAGHPESSASAAPKGVNFWREVYPILETSCLSCHGPRKAAGGFRIDRRVDFFGSDGQPPLVIPGNSKDSPLTAIVTGARKDIAFPDRHRLTRKDVEVVQRWIDAGAEWPTKRE